MITPPLEPFVDPLPLPSRLLASEHGGRLTVSIRSGAHTFHRDLPASRIWGYEGIVPVPTIEAERERPVTVEWRNELQGAYPVSVTVAPEATDADGVSVQCFPGLSGGEPDRHAAELTGHTVVHLHGALAPACTTAGPRTSSRPDRRPSSTTPWTSGLRCSGTTITSWASPSSTFTQGWQGSGSCVTTVSASSSSRKGRRSKCRF